MSLQSVRVAVLTVSDRVAAGSREDAGGDALGELLETAGATRNAREVTARAGRDVTEEQLLGALPAHRDLDERLHLRAGAGEDVLAVAVREQAPSAASAAPRQVSVAMRRMPSMTSTPLSRRSRRG